MVLPDTQCLRETLRVCSLHVKYTWPMLRYCLRRLFLIPLVLVAVNVIGFAYAHAARYVQQLQNPYGTRARPPDIPALYADYAAGLAQLNFGSLQAGARTPLLETLGEQAQASLGLLAIVALLSAVAGLLLGLAAVRVQPPGVAAWLTPFASLGLATPSFYLGTLFIALSVFLVLRGWREFPLPLSGFGWDEHLVLPTLALMIRPTMQIAQVTAHLLADEIRKQYVVTARSVGNTWQTIRWKHALRNALAPALLNVFGAFRFSVGELVLVEWLFSWPGLGRLLALTLIAPNMATPASVEGGGQFFLNPNLLAMLLALFTLIFLTLDTLASGLARTADPRLRAAEGARAGD